MSDNKTLKITRFIKRLYHIVNDKAFPEINWTEDGLHIYISDKNAFMENGLKYLSKTSEYSTFVRLLYVYGFTKSKTLNANQEEYFHKNFQRNGEKMLCCIKRTIEKQSTLLAKNTCKTPTQLQDLLQYLNTQNFKLENEVQSLRERVDQQDLTINGLVQILGRLFRTNENSLDLNNNRVSDKITDYANNNFTPYNTTRSIEKYLNNNLEDIKKQRINEKHKLNKKNENNPFQLSVNRKSIFDFDDDESQYEPEYF